MTEDEAKTKWCPESRNLVAVKNSKTELYTSIASANRSAPEMGDVFPTCIGSACMAWRWNTTVKYPDNYFNGLTRAQPETIVSTTHGYCGKAGRP